MLFGFAILLVAVLLSGVAAYYSVAGLVTIFSAATIPVIIMGGSLELGKIAATVWLHNNWRRAGWAFKSYLVPAVAFLMLLTSMGIFGYLSKAHSDQSLVSGDVQAKIAIYDEKIKTERDNIDANRKALKQLDEAVDQIMGRSSDEKGAEKAVQIRRSQQAERGRLLKEIEQSQKRITAFNEERAPVAAEVRKVEAEVGPIKYIAALVYGDNPDANLLEKAVRFVIIMIVLVFDPLALALILAANKQFEWARQGRGGWAHDDPKYPPDDGALTDDQIDQIKDFESALAQKRAVAQALDSQQDLPVNAKDITVTEQPLPHHPDTHPYLRKGFVYPKDWEFVAPIPSTNVSKAEDIDDQETDPSIKLAIKRWKRHNPTSTLKEERRKLARGEITELPWMEAKYTTSGFGTQWPSSPERGDLFVKTDRMPSQLYKFNGNEWIAIDKNSTDNYTYDTAYIDYLIEKIATGEYDPDLLSDAERTQVAQQLLNQPNTNA
jgi:hypothetical protein